LMPGLLGPSGAVGNRPELIAPPNTIEDDELETGDDDADASTTL
jgi:hypothetical protein